MQGRDDVAGFIAGFAGDDRYVVDYLVGEVLERQPEAVRDFLLQTSILSRLNGSVCDATTGHGGGQAMLETLDRGNLFVVALDDRRHWYRYHHLFADVLRARLIDEQPELVGELHGRAADWCEANGERSEAIGHALAGRDFDRAADLIEAAIPAMRQRRQEGVLREWLEQLPAEVFSVRPVLAVQSVGALMATGDLAGVEERLAAAEQWLDADPATGSEGGSAEMVVVDEAGFGTLPASIAMFRAAQARLMGDLPATRVHARRVLELAGEDDHLQWGAAASLLGLTYWSEGDLEEAHRWFAQGMASVEKAGHEADVIAGTNTLADIRIAQGRLSDAMDHYERALRLAAAADPPIVRGVADMNVGISEVLRERNDLDGARRHLAVAMELGEQAGFPQHPYRWRVATALLARIDGDLATAVELLDQAERVYDTDFSPEVRRPSAVRARVLVAEGRVAEAMAWARERGLSPDDELTYVSEYEHITLARALLASGGRR